MDLWLDRALHEIDAATEGLSPQQMAWRPAEGKWSVAEILDHLSSTYRGTVGALLKVNAGGRPAAGPGSFLKWLSVRVVNDLGYFPSGRQAPAFALPRGTPPDRIAQEVRGNLLQMASVLEESERKFGRHVKIADHPVIGPLTVTEWCKFHYRHAHHHIKQIHALRPRLPAGRSAAAPR